MAGQESRPGGGQRLREEPSFPYVRYGLAAGVLGALVVAVFFLIFDLIAGRPFATPNALGAAAFLREPIDLDAPLRPPVILGYTLLHGAVFVAIGSVGAILALTVRRALRSAAVASLLIAAGLFAAIQVVFFGFTLMTEAELADALGGLRIACANLLAAGVMSVPLSRAYLRHGPEDDREAVAPAGRGDEDAPRSPR